MVNIMGPKSFTYQVREEKDDDDSSDFEEDEQYKTGCFSLRKISKGDATGTTGGSRLIRRIRKGKYALGRMKMLRDEAAVAAVAGTLTNFDWKMLRDATDNFDSAKKIGEGGFGTVYKGVLRDGTKIAIKRLSRSSRQGVEEFHRELKAVSTLAHPNIIRLLGYYNKGDEFMIVYEYMPNGSLDKALFTGLQNSATSTLSWGTRIKICIGIAKALAFVHEETLRIIHRDIKLSNVLLDEDLNPKIADFGLARLLGEAESSGCSTTRIVGTYGYMAPEYMVYGKVTKKLDVFSFGVVMFELMSGKRVSKPGQNLLSWAFDLKKKGDLLQLIDRNIFTNDLAKEAMLILDLAMLCTNFCPTIRPTMSEVVSIIEGKTIMKTPLILPDQEHFYWNYSGSFSHTASNNNSRIDTVPEENRTVEDDALSSADSESVYDNAVPTVNTPLRPRVEGESTQNALDGGSHLMVQKDDVYLVRENVATSESSVSRSIDRSCTRLYMDATELVDNLQLEYVGPSFKQGKFHIDCSDEEFNAGCTEWRDSLVGWFVDDKPPPSNVDNQAVERLQEVKGEFSVFCMDNGYLFQFTNTEDMITALESAPWLIDGRPLVLRKWDWKLKLDRAKMMKSLPIWVEIYNLPLFLWSSSGFSKVGSSLGIPLYSDRKTISKQNLSCARLCIEVDALKELPDALDISVRGTEYKLNLKYEWKPFRCATCRIFGHIESECSLVNMK